jgi:hypothetical protein
MTRHFLTLYLSIVIVLAAVSWGQERLWQSYGGAQSELPQANVLKLLDGQLQAVPREQRADLVANAARDTGLDLDLLEPQDVAGAAAIGGLANGKPVLMDGADGRSWVLQRVEQDDRVLAFRFENEPSPSGLACSLIHPTFSQNEYSTSCGQKLNRRMNC